MKKFIYALPVILILILITLFIVASSKENTTPVAVIDSPQAHFFTWRYENDNTLNPDGGAQTNIFLDVQYTDGTVTTKFIDTFPGTCNEYSSPDKDVYTESRMIICYYAGLGQYYKVISLGGKYLVQRKMFEEGTPEYVPLVEEFETIAEF